MCAWATLAVALDTGLDVSQLGHTAWRIRDGFAKGTVHAFAQTPDGYLWMGTELGLMRFDGVQNVRWQPPSGASLPDERIRVLFTDKGGTLWIGTWAGLASWNGDRLVSHPEIDGMLINGVVQDREGTIWVAAQSTTTGFVCTFRAAGNACEGEDGRFGAWVTSLYEDRSGRLWAASSAGVWRLVPSPRVQFSLPVPVLGVLQSLTEYEGALVVVTPGSVWQIKDDTVKPLTFPGLASPVRPNGLLRDRRDALWVGTAYGLFHVHNGRSDAFRLSDGLSGDHIEASFEDREGNVWVATTDGVDRFRTLAATTIGRGQGLSETFALLADQDGSIWVSTREGLRRWQDGRWTAYRSTPLQSSEVQSVAARSSDIHDVRVADIPDSSGALLKDSQGRMWLGSQGQIGYFRTDRFFSIAGTANGMVDAIVEDGAGTVWVAHRDLGLLKVSPTGTVHSIAWDSISSNGPARRLAIDTRNGGLWLGYFTGGVAHFIDGRIVASYSAADGLAKGFVHDVRVDANGTVWVAADGGFSRLESGHIATLDSKGGLPCGAVDSFIVDDDEAIWLYTACGLVRVESSDLQAWARSTESQVRSRPTYLIVDDSDGVRSVSPPITNTAPHAAKGRDGRLWFVTPDGITFIDPRNLPFNKLPPPVRIERVSADRTSYDLSAPLHLPARVRDLEINYTAPSLVAPEKSLFRYKLEGRDHDWQDAGNRRRAFYTDLSPGDYRFRVIAANNSGVWNEEGASVDFTIAAAYWQTNGFRALCVLAFLGSLYAVYRLRVRQIARQFNLTFDARVNERTRIARDLHDTLLQSFHGLLLRFQTALKLLPPDAAEARQVLASAIRQAAAAITEGRDAVQGLRASVDDGNDLIQSLRSLVKDLAAEVGSAHAPITRIEEQGAPRTLHPLVHDEIFRIASESLRNAFRHALANQVEVEIRYDIRQFRLSVRDDGKGIDASVLIGGGREGHFGLRGIRERAERLGGKVEVWSASNTGTEVSLTIPGRQAYTASGSLSLGSIFREKLFERTGSH